MPTVRTYIKDRIQTPLRRIGNRGEGAFEPVSWDEALDEIGKRLGDCRRKYNASAVAFTGGFSPWNRAALQRLAYSFGSVNYGSSWSLERSGAAIAGGGRRLHEPSGHPPRRRGGHMGLQPIQQGATPWWMTRDEARRQGHRRGPPHHGEHLPPGRSASAPPPRRGPMQPWAHFIEKAGLTGATSAARGLLTTAPRQRFTPGGWKC